MTRQYNLTEEQLKVYRGKYYMHRANAHNRVNRRGITIEFKLTFDEWLDIWLASGHIDQAGRASSRYVMARKDLDQHYTPENTHIVTSQASISHTHKGLSKNRGDHNLRLGQKHSEETKKLMRDIRKNATYQKPNTPIMTPAGQFSCIREAAEYMNVTPEAIHYFKRKYPTEYYYIV